MGAISGIFKGSINAGEDIFKALGKAGNGIFKEADNLNLFKGRKSEVDLDPSSGLGRVLQFINDTDSSEMNVTDVLQAANPRDWRNSKVGELLVKTFADRIDELKETGNEKAKETIEAVFKDDKDLSSLLDGQSLMAKMLNQISQNEDVTLKAFKDSERLIPVDTLEKYQEILRDSYKSLKDFTQSISSDLVPEDIHLSAPDLNDFYEKSIKQNAEVLADLINYSPDSLGEKLDGLSPMDANKSLPPSSLPLLAFSGPATVNQSIHTLGASAISQNISGLIDTHGKDLEPNAKLKMHATANDVIFQSGLAIPANLMASTQDPSERKPLEDFISKHITQTPAALGKEFARSMYEAYKQTDEKTMGLLSEGMRSLMTSGLSELAPSNVKEPVSKIIDLGLHALDNIGYNPDRPAPESRNISGPKIHR